MRESFVIHSEYIEDLPEEYKERFLQMVYNYGIHEEVPILDGLEQSLWIKIQRRIDLDRDTYETRKAKLKEYKENWKKSKKNDSVNSESFGIIENHTESFGIIPTNTSSVIVNDSVNVNDNVFVNVNDIENVSVIDNVSDATELPSKDAPSTINYSKIIFELFRDASLPCAKGNEISFLQTDFKNGLNYLHKTSEFQHIHSDDVIGAVKNYIEVLQNPDCYVSNRMNFFQLVKSKNFYNYLPQNFDVENFHNFGTTSAKTQSDDVFKDYEKKYISSPCSKCGGTRIFLNPNIKKWICDDCFGQFPFSSYKGDAK